MDLTVFENVLKWADVNNVSAPYALALFAQARLESANFTSNVYQNTNNAFGMRIAQKRQQNRVGEYETKGNGTFAVYACLEDSFHDRIALDIYNGVQMPLEFDELGQYMSEVLGNNYVPPSERPQYLQSWQVLVQDVYNRSDELQTYGLGADGFNFKSLAVKGGISLGLIAALWLFRKRIPIIKNFF